MSHHGPSANGYGCLGIILISLVLWAIIFFFVGLALGWSEIRLP